MKIHNKNKPFWFLLEKGCPCGCGMRGFSVHEYKNYIDKYFLSIVIFNLGTTITLLKKLPE